MSAEMKLCEMSPERLGEIQDIHIAVDHLTGTFTAHISFSGAVYGFDGEGTAQTIEDAIRAAVKDADDGEE